ncbi:NUDIX domain-containing protein [Candidatus Peregrinibacteria bacterium]|nr:NUDIX domain-containing protein [Candidatus Peregrinibacteria bacterium]
MRRHFTATAFVVDSKGRTLLLWHKRLQRWMPPGGHVDPDETPEDCARRECKEETGLDIDIIGDAQENIFSGGEDEGRILKKPFAFLLEDIPACPERQELEHQHMDFVYMARPLNEDQMLNLAEEEGAELKWFTRTDIEALSAEEIYANVKNYILSVLP